MIVADTRRLGQALRAPQQPRAPWPDVGSREGLTQPTTEPRFRGAIADYLERERAHVEAQGEAMADMTPFRKDLLREKGDG